MIKFVSMSITRIFKFVLIVALLINPIRVWAQLKGVYTIGTTGSDYSTFESFVSDFNKNGVNGDVILNFNSDITLSQTTAILKPSSNPTNAKSRLIINGKGKKLVGNLKREMIFLNGVDHVVFKNLTFENQYSASSLMGVRFSNQADSNTIDSCIFNFSKLKTIATQEGGYVVFAHIDSAIAKAPNAFSNGIGNTISNCVMQSTGGSPGPNYGILDQQNASGYSKSATNNSFLNNRITNFYSSGIYMRYVNGEQAIGNKISRSDASSSDGVDSIVKAIYLGEAYTFNRTIRVDNNEFYYLPYKGATTSSTSNLISKLYGVHAVNVVGDAANKWIVSLSGNSMHDLVYSSLFHGIFSEFGEVTDMNSNTIRNVNGVGGNAYGIYANYGSDVKMNRNRVLSCNFGSGGSKTIVIPIYALDVQSVSYTMNEIQNNFVDSNSTGGEFYGISSLWSGSWSVKNNRVLMNTSKGNSTGIVAACYFVYLQNLDFVGNLLARNYGDAETHGLYTINYNSGNNLNILQNTFYDRDDNNSSHISSLVWVDDDSNIDFIGNIVDGKGSGTGTIVSLYTYNTIGKISSNSITSNYSTEWWAIETNQYSDYTDWKNSGFVDDDNYNINSKFVNESQSDFRPKNIKNQNNVSTSTISDKDLMGKKRNPIGSDRGCFEDSMNLRMVRAHFSLADSICNGYELNLKMTVANDYSDTISELIVGYVFNGKLVTEKIKKTILPKDTAVLQFSNWVKLNAAGKQTLKLFIAQSNDFTKDDTLAFSTFVKKAPGGSKLSLINNTGSKNNPYVISSSQFATYLGLNVSFDVTAPTGMNRSDYGSTKKWMVSTSARTSSGKSISGSSVTVPSGSSDLKWNFISNDTLLEDSTVQLQLKISDNVNGCDTIVNVWVYISPTPKLNFNAPSKLCSNDTIQFVNKSTIKGKNSFMDYTWKYGTSTLDSSNDIDGSFIYTSGGNYSVKLMAKTYPYGFVFEKTSILNITQTPTAKFTRNSGCEGQDIVFSNISSDTLATMIWNFGDNSGDKTISKMDFGYKYNKYGTYTVVLNAIKNGCSSTAQNKVTVFENPKVGFTYSGGNCMGDKITFTNTTVMNSSLFGVVWNFDENGAVSTQKNTSYSYAKSGTKNVKLVINSEFGCNDSITKSITIKPSPQADFVVDRLCLNSKTLFENKTPKIAGTSEFRVWFIDKMQVSSKDTIQWKWDRVGDHTINLNVQLDNGCTSRIERVIRVLNEVKPQFTFEEVCSGDTVHFVNKTEFMASDSLSYHWDFGNGDTFSGFNASQKYSPIQNQTYNVTLKSQLKNGCESITIKPVNVFEMPKTCDFEYTTAYENAFWGAKLEPKNTAGVVGGQEGVNYQWNVKGIGNKSSSNLSASVIYDLGSDGTFEVSMVASTAEKGCECRTTKTIIMNRTNTESLKKQSMIIFPNPIENSRIFLKSDLWSSAQENSIFIRDVLGRNIPFDQVSFENGIIELDLGSITSGLYFVEVRNSQGLITGQFQKN